MLFATKKDHKNETRRETETSSDRKHRAELFATPETKAHIRFTFLGLIDFRHSD